MKLRVSKEQPKKSRLGFQVSLALVLSLLVIHRIVEFKRNNLQGAAISALQLLIDGKYEELAKFATPEEQKLNLVENLRIADEIVLRPGLAGSTRLEGFDSEVAGYTGVAFAKYQLKNGETLDVGLSSELTSEGAKGVLLEKVLRYGWLAGYMSSPNYIRKDGDMIHACVLGLRRDRHKLEEAGLTMMYDQMNLRPVSLEIYQQRMEALLEKRLSDKKEKTEAVELRR